MSILPLRVSIKSGSHSLHHHEAIGLSSKKDALIATFSLHPVHFLRKSFRSKKMFMSLRISSLTRNNGPIIPSESKIHFTYSGCLRIKNSTDFPAYLPKLIIIGIPFSKGSENIMSSKFINLFCSPKVLKVGVAGSDPGSVFCGSLRIFFIPLLK